MTTAAASGNDDNGIQLIGQVVLTAALFGLTAFFAVKLARHSGFIAAVWPANGILLASAMMARRRHVPLIVGAAFVANLAANVANEQGMVIAAFLSLCGSIEILAALGITRVLRLSQWKQVEAPRILAGFWCSACIFAPLLSAALAAAGLHQLVGVPMRDIFGAWWAANALGLALVTPLLLVFFRDGVRASCVSLSRRGALLSLLLLTAITAGVFCQSRYPFIFMVFPPLVVVAFYADFLGVAVGLAIVTLVSITLTVLGTGPLMLIPGTSNMERISTLQIFLATLLVMGFPVAAALSERRKLERKLELLATTDALTGLSTRRRFEEHFHTVWGESLRDRSPVTVMMIDIDFFKAYNDGYGHLRGDDCIRAVADIVSGVARRPLDLAVRYGGEEFLLLLSNASLHGAIQLATELHQTLARARVEHKGSPYGYVTMSIGVASITPDSTMASASIVEAADDALYRAKRGGRSRTEIAEPQRR